MRRSPVRFWQEAPLSKPPAPALVPGASLQSHGLPGADITFLRKALRKHPRTAQATGYVLHVFFGVCILAFVNDPVAGIIAVMPIVFGLIGLARLLKRISGQHRKRPERAG